MPSVTFRKLGYSEQEAAEIIEKQKNSFSKQDKKLLKCFVAAYQQPLPTLDDIQQFEQQKNVRLPDDYKTFLLTHNGGKPSKSYLERVENTVRNFLAFSSPYDYYSLIWLSAIDSPCCIDGQLAFIPIATTSNGDDILMSVKQADYARIYYYAHDDDGSPADWPLLANSFSDLLTQLAPLPED